MGIKNLRSPGLHLTRFRRARAMRPCSPRPGASHRQRSGIDCVLPKDGAPRRTRRPRGIAPPVRVRVGNRPGRCPRGRGRRARRAVAGRPGRDRGGSAAAHLTSARAVPAIGHPILTKALTAPISTSDCRTRLGIACYSPVQYRVAYNLNPLYKGGITGAGRTIVIVDSFGSPTIANDLHVFDQQWGFPDPGLQVMKFGNVPPFDPNDPTMVGWAQETTLDVEYAHAIAPGAKIVLAETPVAEVEGTSGLPEMMNAEKSLIDRGIGDVITQSFGATENTFPGFDSGNFSTMLNLDNSGSRLSPDVVWNDGFGAGGGGVSGVFPRPAYQSLVTKEVGKKRGTPDISMSAAVNGGAWVYYSFINPGSPWHIFGGTSEASPIFSGIVALADQVAHHRLGLLNPGLYLMGALSQHVSSTGIVDVTSGNNSFAGVTGFDAGTGYDLASGWGTIDAAKFVPALARFG